MTEELVLPTAIEATDVVVEDGKSFYVSEQGWKIGLKPINPMLLRMALVSIKLPKRPTYETRTGGGRLEVFPLDEVSAGDNPQDAARWEAYTEDREEAQGERTNASMRATFYYGTAFTPPNDGWDVEQRMLGIDVPDQPELRKAHFLMTMLNMKDMNGLMRAITRNMGVSEDTIKAAEDSFRD